MDGVLDGFCGAVAGGSFCGEKGVISCFLYLCSDETFVIFIGFFDGADLKCLYPTS